MNGLTHDDVGDDDEFKQLIGIMIEESASFEHFFANASGEGDAAAGPEAAPGYYHAGPHPNHANQHAILPHLPDAVRFNDTSADGDAAAGPAKAPGYYHAGPHHNHVLPSLPDAVRFNDTSADGDAAAGPEAAPGYYHAGPHHNRVLPSLPDAVRFNDTSADGDAAVGPAVAPGYYHAGPHPNQIAVPPPYNAHDATPSDSFFNDESHACVENAKLNISWNMGFGDAAKKIISNNEYDFSMKSTLVLMLAIALNIFPQSNAHFFLSKLMIVLVYECCGNVEKTCLNDTIKYLNKISTSIQQMEFHVTDKHNIKPFATTATWRDARSKKKLKCCDRVAATAQALFWLVSADGSGESLKIYMRGLRLLTTEQLGKLNNAAIAANAAAKIMVVDELSEVLDYADDPRIGSLGRKTKTIMNIVSIFIN